MNTTIPNATAVRALALLADTLQAWEGEEDSVQEEHAEHIAELAKFFAEIDNPPKARAPGEREPVWCLAYHCNSRSPRAQRWYHVSRLVKIDGKWWELYWSEIPSGKNAKHVRDAAAAAGIELMAGTFCEAPAPRHGSVMVWSLDKAEA